MFLLEARVNEPASVPNAFVQTRNSEAGWVALVCLRERFGEEERCIEINCGLFASKSGAFAVAQNALKQHQSHETHLREHAMRVDKALLELWTLSRLRMLRRL